MRPILRHLAFVVVVSAVSSCGGGNGGGPTTPAAPTSTVTVSVVAPSLASEINSSFIAAMRAGVPVASRGLDRPGVLLSRFFETLISVSLSAQSGFVANCSRGGNVRIQYLGPAPQGGRVTLSNTAVTYSGCAHSLNGRDIAANGTLTANGTWTATQPNTPVRLSGDVSVDGVGTIAINGQTGGSFSGAIGGITVGSPDTPPPPNPTTTTSTTTTTIPPTTTTSVATTSIIPINLTGTWTVSGGGSLSIVQSGSTLSCTVLGLPAGTTQVSCGGSISGSAVNLSVNLLVVVSAAGFTTTCPGSTTMSLTATNTTMTGTQSSTASCTIAGPPPLPPSPPPTTSSGPVTLTKA